MYVQGVSTRKVTDILVKLPGPEVSIFPNTASCLRPVSALLADCDEDWMTGKIHLNLKD